ncbi:MAG: hypothetical protein JWO11_3966 [Nocardioides sp.]|nr:hypothetical protein [Nocardioides sp.]
MVRVAQQMARRPPHLDAGTREGHTFFLADGLRIVADFQGPSREELDGTAADLRAVPP